MNMFEILIDGVVFLVWVGWCGAKLGRRVDNQSNW